MRDNTNIHMWEYRELKPNRFILEDRLPSEQKTSDIIWHGVEYFVGVELKCIACKEKFIFSAAEQKTWHHEWGFSIHSYPKHCIECRKTNRKKLNLLKELSESTKIFDDDIKKCNKVVIIIKELMQLGVVINERQGERILYFFNRSDYKVDMIFKFKLLNRNYKNTPNDY